MRFNLVRPFKFTLFEYRKLKCSHIELLRPQRDNIFGNKYLTALPRQFKDLFYIVYHNNEIMNLIL